VDRERPTPVYASLDAPADHVLGEDDALVSLPTRTPMVFTPDGRSLVIQAARAGKPQLFLRSLDRPDARPIAGTDDARVPFVSPDGTWVGFWSANEIRKVPMAGGGVAVSVIAQPRRANRRAASPADDASAEAVHAQTVVDDRRERRRDGVEHGLGDTLASKTTSASNIPPEFWKQADDVAGWSPSDTIDYVDSSGKTKTIKIH
jgi:hypothetical protein